MRRHGRGLLVSATIFNRTVIGTARTAGADATQLIRRLGIDRNLLDDPDGWLPATAVEEFLTLLGEELDHPAPGLWVGENVSPDAADLLGYAMQTAPSLGHAYATAARYYGLVGTGIEVYFRQEDESGFFVHAVPPELAPEHRHRDELIIASLVTTGRSITSFNWMPAHVTFQHPEPLDTMAHRALLGDRIWFDKPATELSISTADLRRPSQSADDRLHDILERYARSLVQSDLDQPALVQQLRSSIMGALPAGDLSVAALARSLGMSSRTLQRRLRERGTSHQELLRQTRHYLAESYLRSSELSIDEVAFLLGYANTPAFSRAFKGWTGMAPTRYRTKHFGVSG